LADASAEIKWVMIGEHRVLNCAVLISPGGAFSIQGWAIRLVAKVPSEEGIPDWDQEFAWLSTAVERGMRFDKGQTGKIQASILLPSDVLAKVSDPNEPVRWSAEVSLRTGVWSEWIATVKISDPVALSGGAI